MIEKIIKAVMGADNYLWIRKGQSGIEFNATATIDYDDDWSTTNAFL